MVEIEFPRFLLDIVGPQGFLLDDFLVLILFSVSFLLFSQAVIPLILGGYVFQ